MESPDICWVDTTRNWSLQVLMGLLLLGQILTYFRSHVLTQRNTCPYAFSPCKFLYVPKKYWHIPSTSYINFMEIRKTMAHLLVHFMHFWCTFGAFYIFYILLILIKSTKILCNIWIRKITKLVKLLILQT
jgi:hypothetical protein